ncbi:hypothetical protein MCHI_001260 [Candidatus Magnetoovum chiemensis]|nr:hypothetical protein MCHI_001260 [Candidatus Magnetoovum chiemensis]
MSPLSPKHARSNAQLIVHATHVKFKHAVSKRARYIQTRNDER